MPTQQGATMQVSTLLKLSSAVAQLDSAIEDAKRDNSEVIARDDHMEMVEHFVEVRATAELIKKMRKSLDAIEDNLSHEAIPECFKRAKIKSTTIENIGRVSIGHTWYCSILDGKKPDAFVWLREGGNGAIITETIPWQTLAAFAKSEAAEHNRDMPDAMFKTTITPYTSITKG
jgi:hypothetical protein